MSLILVIAIKEPHTEPDCVQTGCLLSYQNAVGLGSHGAPKTVWSPEQVDKRDCSRGLHGNTPEIPASPGIAKTQKWSQKQMASA